MGDAVGQVLAPAVAVALSPFPIIPMVLILLGRRARAAGPAFLAGWSAGLALVGAAVLVVAGPVDEAGPDRWVGGLKLVLGLVLVALALKGWRGRPRGGEEQALPGWMGALEGMGPGRALALGAASSGLNPKIALLAVAAAGSVAALDLPAGESALGYAVFCLVASAGVLVPVVIRLALGARSLAVLGAFRGWLARNNAVIMAVVSRVIGVVLIADAVAILT
jgi:hypothetical protein